MKAEEIYKRSNNLYQSLDWLDFQKSYKRKIVNFSKYSGIELELPLNRKAVWVQKAPDRISAAIIKEIANVEADFVRIEPLKLSSKDIKKYSLRQVTEKSVLSGQKSPKATSVIDISKSEEEIIANMKPKTRYNIRLSVRKKVSVRATNDFDTLFKLLFETSQRQKSYSPHPREYYANLIKTLGKKDLAKVFIAYNEGNEPIAAILVSFFGEIATYLHGGFNDKYKNLMAPYLCHMEAIRHAKKKGCRYYDMWGVAESDDPQDPWAGITRFKEGFGGEKIVFPGSFDYVNNNFWYNLLTFMARLKKVTRKCWKKY